MRPYDFFMRTHTFFLISSYICIMIYKRVFILPKDREIKEDILEILYHTEGTFDVRRDRIVTADQKIIKKADDLALATV